MKIEVAKSAFRRFDSVGMGSAKIGDPMVVGTVVRVRSKSGVHTMTVKKIKWSKYRLINKLIRLWIIIRY
jgi:hypothetical protein